METEKRKKLEFKTETIASLTNPQQRYFYGGGDDLTCTCKQNGCTGRGTVGADTDKDQSCACEESWNGSCIETCPNSCVETCANCNTDGCTDPTPTLMMSKQLMCPPSYPIICL